MRRPTTRVLVLAIAALGFAVVGAVVARTQIFDRPPVRCRVAPRSPAELRDLVGEAAPAIVAPAAASQPHPFPSGGDVDDREPPGGKTWATVREAARCAEAGDAGRFYALYTDDFLRRSFAVGGPGSGMPLAAAVSQAGLPSPPVWRGSWALPDGRVGGVFGNPQLTPTPDRGRPVYVVFREVGGRWLIDDAVPFAPEETPAP